jgi:hypothetical protein
LFRQGSETWFWITGFIVCSSACFVRIAGIFAPDAGSDVLNSDILVRVSDADAWVSENNVVVAV